MKILVFLTRFPYPLNKGDKLRAFNQIKELSLHNDVYLFCLTYKQPAESDVAKVRKYCKDIHVECLSKTGVFYSLLKSVFTRLPLQVALFTSFASKQNFLEYYNRVNPDLAYYQFVRSAEYAKVLTCSGEKKRCAMVLDFQDCLSMNIFRRAMCSGLLMKFVLMQEVKKLREYENAMFDIFDACTIITVQDRNCMVSDKRKSIKIIENGVDNGYFTYPLSDNKEFDVIFTGNMSYKPNIVAAQFLINEVMPLVWKKDKNVKVALAGSNPVKQVRVLAQDRVVVTGWVDDMREYYAKSRIFIAPMQIGTGLQNKLLEAMAMGLPCITTPLANSALNTEANKHILVAESEYDLAEHILDLINDREYGRKIADAGHGFVAENYKWSVSVSKLERLFNAVVQRRRTAKNVRTEHEV